MSNIACGDAKLHVRRWQTSRAALANIACGVGKHRVRRWIFLPAALEKMVFLDDCFIILHLKSLSFGSDKM